MINKNELLQIAKLFGMRPWQQEKHYVQSLILVAIADYAVVFKGGTYLWFFHKLPRFSEDLDFSAFDEIDENLPEYISNALYLFGVENNTKLISNDNRTFSFRISAKGPLNTSLIDLCHVYVEISKREKIILKQMPISTTLEPYGLPIKILRGMNLHEVSAEKTRTVLTRNKARDLYDLWFLIRQGFVPNKDLINEKLKFYNEEFSFPNFENKVMDYKNIWNRELKPIIFGKVPDFQLVYGEIISLFKNI